MRHATMHALTSIASAAMLGSVAVAQPQPAAEGSRTYTIALTGAAEVPGPGDADGSGTATITVSVPNTEVCYELAVSDIGTPTAAHLHKGVVGEAGPPVVTLDAPADGSSEACADIDAKLAAQLLARPQQYYVNVHNAEFPAGALRGQLG